MACYSSFFSSGLLAAHHSPPSSPPISRPDSPLIIPQTPRKDALDFDEDPTPIPSERAPSRERPRLRKRRSSLNISNSPMAQIKSPVRAANFAAQKQSAMNRSRSGSINEYGQPRSSGVATEGNSLMGRLRSGSLGTMLRSRRVLRKPLGPPPSMPLPPVPIQLPMSSSCDESDDGSPPSTPSHLPLMTRASSKDNYGQESIPNSPTSFPCFLTEFPDLGEKFFGREVDDDDIIMKEN